MEPLEDIVTVFLPSLVFSVTAPPAVPPRVSESWSFKSATTSPVGLRNNKPGEEFRELTNIPPSSHRATACSDTWAEGR